MMEEDSDIMEGGGMDDSNQVNDEERKGFPAATSGKSHPWFGFAASMCLLFVVAVLFLLANFAYNRPLSGGFAKDYDGREGEVGNDAMNAKVQDQKQHGGPHNNKWNNRHHSGSPASAMNSAPGWIVHQHQKNSSTANNNKINNPLDSAGQEEETEADDSSSTSTGLNSEQDDHGEEAESDQQNNGGDDQQQQDDDNEVAAAWLESTVTLKDGVKYEVVDQLEHDDDAFTQGLTYHNGVLYESTGLYYHSSVRRLDPETGEAIEIVPLAMKNLFGEGMVYLDGKLIQITWKSGKGFIYNATNLTEPPEQFEYQTTNGEGWGITHNPERNELIVTDGTNHLHYWDPNDLGNTMRTLAVTRQDGTPATNLNELEFWRGRLLANVWFQDCLLVIHPETGKVEKEYDFSQIWPKKERPFKADVFNGISVSADPNILYVTGKKWNRIFRVKLLA